MATRKRAKKKQQRCEFGVSLTTGKCRLRRWRRPKKGKKARPKGPVGSPLYKDVMAYARGGRRFGCDSAERKARAQAAFHYLDGLYKLEAERTLSDAQRVRRNSALDRTYEAVRKLLIDTCLPNGKRVRATSRTARLIGPIQAGARLSSKKRRGNPKYKHEPFIGPVRDEFIGPRQQHVRPHENFIGPIQATAEAAAEAAEAHARVQSAEAQLRVQEAQNRADLDAARHEIKKLKDDAKAAMFEQERLRREAERATTRAASEAAVPDPRQAELFPMRKALPR